MAPLIRRLSAGNGRYLLTELVGTRLVSLALVRARPVGTEPDAPSPARTAALLGLRSRLPGIERTANGLVTFTRLAAGRTWALGLRRRSGMLERAESAGFWATQLANYQGKTGGADGYLPAE